MKTELYRAIKSIDISKLIQDDLEELLIFFMDTKNDLIRNQIAFIFSDLKYDKAVPFIIEKINDRNILHNNGSLVFSLAGFDMKEHSIELVKMICELEYEPRLMAYQIVQEIASQLDKDVRLKALEILDESRRKLNLLENDKGENSTLHFVEKTEDLLKLSMI